mmetsp:Transcript_74053/g.130893  ORF Transcript_74053/g.130893 Transcript_74053/m.130893 type:complete len:118 (+) Transcript_74053:2324-2677(+)
MALQLNLPDLDFAATHGMAGTCGWASISATQRPTLYPWPPQSNASPEAARCAQAKLKLKLRQEKRRPKRHRPELFPQLWKLTAGWSGERVRKAMFPVGPVICQAGLCKFQTCSGTGL